jgi:uncharacterized protein DUF6682
VSIYSELKENVVLELGLDDTASGDEDNLLGRRLNEAVREVLRRTRCRVATATVDLTAGEGDYELPVDIIAITNIINSDGAPLQRESVEYIHILRRGENPLGTNVYRYAVDGANLLMVYPEPDSASELTLYYVPLPTEMSSGSHDPSSATYGGIPVEYHPLIEDWACYRMARFDDDNSSGNGEYYRQRFEEGVIRARNDIRRRGGRTLGPARVGRRTRVPWNPGQDVWR